MVKRVNSQLNGSRPSQRVPAAADLLAERETTMILEMLRGISEKLGVKEERREDLAELIKETRIEELATKLDQALPSSD